MNPIHRRKARWGAALGLAAWCAAAVALLSAAEPPGRTPGLAGSPPGAALPPVGPAAVAVPMKRQDAVPPGGAAPVAGPAAPTTPRGLLDEAARLAREGRREESLVKYRQLADAVPPPPEAARARFELADLLVSMGRVGPAEEQYERLLGAASGVEGRRASARLAEMAQGRGDFKRARHYWKPLLQGEDELADAAWRGVVELSLASSNGDGLEELAALWPTTPGASQSRRMVAALTAQSSDRLSGSLENLPPDSPLVPYISLAWGDRMAQAGQKEAAKGLWRSVREGGGPASLEAARRLEGGRPPPPTAAAGSGPTPASSASSPTVSPAPASAGLRTDPAAAPGSAVPSSSAPTAMTGARSGFGEAAGGAPGAAEPLPPPSGEELAVGLLVPLSGPQEELGRNLLQAAQLALVGHRDVRLTLWPADAGNGPEDARQALSGLLENSSVKAVIGPVFKEQVEAAGALAAERGVPLIALNPNPELAARFNHGAAGASPEGPRVLLNGIHPDHQAERMAHFAVSERGLRYLAVLAPDSEYGRAAAESFEFHVRRLQGEVVRTLYFPQETVDFAEAIRTLMRADGAAVQRRRDHAAQRPPLPGGE
ncbi:MAG: penicillin-binding protein activator, partial [Magnetococcales bacterium]|nr:penicillin-binding protein activator [Magnetococcales bacterium]